MVGSKPALNLPVNAKQCHDLGAGSQGQYCWRRHKRRMEANYTDRGQNTKSATIAGGNSKNTQLVIASGDDFKLFINNSSVGETHDDSLASGQIGLVAGTLISASTGEASFANLKVFKS